MPDERILSASRIKTLESCSWKYWCNYHQDLPRSSNAGASRGTVCHLVLELLLSKRHKKYIKVITKAGTIEAVPSISRLVKKGLTELGYYDLDNHTMCDEMILVALNCDFLGKDMGGKIKEPEKEFLLESENPKFKIRGFIDKPVEYKTGVKMVDYKTSKQKFTEYECEYNVQALAYLLAAKQIWPKLKESSIEFQFLKFPEQPIIEIKATEDQLEGFKYYLEHIYAIINNFTEQEAHSNFAKDQPRPKKGEGFKGPLNCGFAKRPEQLKKDGTPMWYCEYKFAYDYYVLLGEKGRVLKATKDRESLEGLEGVIEERHYEGCPAHPQPNKVKDDFDF
jgi:hypothetical protein